MPFIQLFCALKKHVHVIKVFGKCISVYFGPVVSIMSLNNAEKKSENNQDNIPVVIVRD